MFGRAKNRFLDGKPIDPNDSGTTVVGEGASFTGDIVSNGDVVIGGELHGAVETAARLHVTSTGTVDGTINAADAKLEGTVEGPVVVTGKLEIGCTARVFGDVCAGRLAIAEGSLVQGSIHTETPAHHFVESRGDRAREVDGPGASERSGPVDRAVQCEDAEQAVPV